MNTDSHHIILLMHRWVGYLHGVQLGIADYLMHRPAWTCTQVIPEPALITQIPHSGVDGVITFLGWDYHREIEDLRIPVVDVSNWRAEAIYPRVLPDDVAIGRLAGEYFVELGLQNFGFLGAIENAFTGLRLKGFSEALTKHGLTVDPIWTRDHVLPKRVKAPVGIDPRILSWLLELPKPAGVFATTDNSAAAVLEVCRTMNIKVPEEICVLGVDNDELTSKVTHPPLSSIALPTHKIGFEAAHLLDRLMSGEAPPAAPILFPPTGVVARQSTNLLLIPDEEVLAAVRYIREQVHRQITVKDLLRAVPINRRYLERKFKQHIGRTPLQEIRRVRMEKAKQLLSGTDLSMPAVASRSGFPNPARLANVFRESTGMTPTKYRKTFRLQDE
jgi:LacI family transcriptional regulator